MVMTQESMKYLRVASEEDKKVLEAQAEAREFIKHKVNVIQRSLEKTAMRVVALHNTAIQCRRKADLLQGQANSLENTARNMQNRINEDARRIEQISEAMLILEPQEQNT